MFGRHLCLNRNRNRLGSTRLRIARFTGLLSFMPCQALRPAEDLRSGMVAGRMPSAIEKGQRLRNGARPTGPRRAVDGQRPPDWQRMKDHVIASNRHQENRRHGRILGNRMTRARRLIVSAGRGRQMARIQTSRRLGPTKGFRLLPPAPLIWVGNYETSEKPVKTLAFPLFPGGRLCNVLGTIKTALEILREIR